MPEQNHVLDLHIYAIKCAMTSQECKASFEKLWQHVHVSAKIPNKSLEQSYEQLEQCYESVEAYRLEQAYLSA